MARPAFSEPGLGDMLRTMRAFGSRVPHPSDMPSGGSAFWPVGFVSREGQITLPDSQLSNTIFVELGRAAEL